MTLNKIEGGTPIKSFPDIYNNNVDALVTEINRLNQLITQKDTEIREMKESFNSALSRLRAEYIAILNTDMSNRDGNYILKARKTGNTVEYTWELDS